MLLTPLDDGSSKDAEDWPLLVEGWGVVLEWASVFFWVSRSFVDWLSVPTSLLWIQSPFNMEIQGRRFNIPANAIAYCTRRNCVE